VSHRTSVVTVVNRFAICAVSRNRCVYISTGRSFCHVSEHGKSHGTSRPMQVFSAIKIPSVKGTLCFCVGVTLSIFDKAFLLKKKTLTF
jgi:hypothetical protein